MESPSPSAVPPVPTLRWAALSSVDAPGGSPWPVFALNLVGSVLLGLLLAEQRTRPPACLTPHDAGGIGLCGRLTTFSSFSVEVVDLARDVATALAIGYVVGSMVAAAAGSRSELARCVAGGPVLLPLEEEP